MARTDAPELISIPELVAGDAFYGRVLDLPLEPTPGLVGHALVSDILGRFETAIIGVREAMQAYARVATTHEVVATARVRIADLFDTLAARLSAIAAVHPEVWSGTGVICRTYCSAARHYQNALDGGTANERARAQLEAYGADFLATCAALPPE